MDNAGIRSVGTIDAATRWSASVGAVAGAMPMTIATSGMSRPVSLALIAGAAALGAAAGAATGHLAAREHQETGNAVLPAVKHAIAGFGLLGAGASLIGFAGAAFTRQGSVGSLIAGSTLMLGLSAATGAFVGAPAGALASVLSH